MRAPPKRLTMAMGRATVDPHCETKSEERPLSDGDKKPGPRDIGDLKNRLGMLNKRVGAKPTTPGANPFAPKSAAPAEDAAPPAIPETADAPAARQPSAPAAPQPFARDLFAGPATVNESGPAPKASAAELADMFDSSVQVLDAPVRAEAQFANPLQMGSYNEGVASINLTADEEEALKSFEGGQRGMRPRQAISLICVAAALALFFGFMLGDVRTSRKMINLQIEASVNLKMSMEPVLLAFDQLKPVISSLPNNEVDWGKIKRIPKDLPSIDGGLILSAPVPFEKDLARSLTNIVSELDLFFSAARTHRMATLVRDRKELEALSTGSAFDQYRAYAVTYESLPPRFRVVKEIAKGWQPPFGKIYGVTGKPQLNPAKTDYLMPLADRGGKTTPVSLTKVLLLRKEELQTASKTNALTLYVQRVADLKVRMKRILDAEANFRAHLDEQASRDKVFSF